MAVYILDNSEELGEKAADLIAKKLNEAIEKRGQARIILSTGASQFETIKYLVGITLHNFSCINYLFFRCWGGEQLARELMIPSFTDDIAKY